jgi:hypothetical protein
MRSGSSPGSRRCGARSVGPAEGREPPRALRAAVALIATAALAAPQSAVAAKATPTPSAGELWQAYPLEATPSPATPEPARSAAAGRGGDSDGGSPWLMPILLIAGAALLGTAVYGAGRRTGVLAAGRRPSLAMALQPGANLTLAGSSAAVAAGPRSPTQFANGMPPRQPGPRRRGRSKLAPPEPGVAWTAEIRWHEPDDQASFQVEARAHGRSPVVITESTPLKWPPSDTGAVTALSETIEGLTKSLVAAGWKPLPDGNAWYAKRFAWAPVVPAERPETEAAPAEPAAGAAARRPWSKPGWPEGTDEMWRCEIAWSEGYVRSRFRAVVYGPGKKRGRTIGESPAFKWMLNAPPDPRSAEQIAEARRLAAAVASAGWERVEPGAEWYAARFVWRRPGPPPDHLLLPPLEGGREE